MLTLVIIALILAVIVYKFGIGKGKKNLKGLKELPSAPGGLPIFGHLFKIGSRPFEYFTDMSDKIGPFYKIQIGWKDFIVLNSNDIVNKCMKEDGNNFAGRWRNTFTDQLARYCGLIFKEKDWWAAQRSFSLHALRDFGFGKAQTETSILKEIEKIVNVLRLSSGKPISSADIVSLATINVISDFTLKKEFKETDIEVCNLMQNIRKVAQGAELNTILVNIFPIFQNFPKIENRLYIALDRYNVVETIERIHEFISVFVKEHKDRFLPNNECQDLIDAFLLEQHKLKESNTAEHSFVDFQAVRLVSELFIAGFETTSTTLTWAFLILSKFPKIQQLMHEEIVDTIGVERFPTMADKKSLNYVQAVMDEILRFVTLVPLSLPHKVLQDTSINGFFVPENSIIFPNIFACHRDPTVWEKPHDFYPEHFLSEGKYNPRQELIPFGVGKRICLGESLAKMEYFMFLVAIIQRFTFGLDADSEKKDNQTLFDGTGGSIRGTIEHKIIFKEIVKDE